MGCMAMRQRIKTGARIGGGPEPGYKWNVGYLTLAADESRFLTETQYEHVVDQIRELAQADDPTHPSTVTVRQVEDFWELKEKGGPLGKINLRVFFIVDKREGKKKIVLLGVLKKENEGHIPKSKKRVISRRRKKYLEGDFE